MKNKHLVFLFVATIVVGLLIRKAPWRQVSFFQTDLIAVDTAAATQISIFVPGRSELLIERTEAGWAATQDMHSVVVPPEQINAMLAGLAHVRSIRIVKTGRPDTLGLSDSSGIQIAVFRDKINLENFGIGYEIMENGRPATYIQLHAHEGNYLVEGHLAGIFRKEITDFRLNIVARFDPADVSMVTFQWRTDSVPTGLTLEKNDSTGQWRLPDTPAAGIANDTLQNWMQLLLRLNDSPFADAFDESNEKETFRSKITLRLQNADSLVFRSFYAKPPEMPEEITLLKAGKLPVYVVHSSQNPLNYFAPPDTTLIRSIFFPGLRFATGRQKSVDKRNEN